MGNTTRLPKRLDVELEVVMRRADKQRGDQLMSVGELPSLLDLAQRQTHTPYVYDDDIDAGTIVGSIAAAEQKAANRETGTGPLLCEWYSLCTRPAAGTVRHPVLDNVPTCRKCADKHDLDVQPAGSAR